MSRLRPDHVMLLTRGRSCAGSRKWAESPLKPPKGITGRQVVAELAMKGYTIGAGLDAMADSMIRIGHMGDLTPAHFAGLLAVLSEVAETSA